LSYDSVDFLQNFAPFSKPTFFTWKFIEREVGFNWFPNWYSTEVGYVCQETSIPSAFGLVEQWPSALSNFLGGFLEWYQHNST
jgi:hypothetical protein